MFTPRILLYRGTGPVSALIRWQTRGAYAHVALQVGPDEIIESMQGYGVRSRHANDLDQADAFLVPKMSAEGWMAAVAFARAQIGKPYDYLGVFRFIDRQPGGGRDSWFCSELVFAAMMAGNVRLLERIDAWGVSPALLALSPLLMADQWDLSKEFHTCRAKSFEDARVRDWKIMHAEA